MHVLCNQLCTSPGQTNLQDKTDGLLEELANLKNTSMEGMILVFRKCLCSFVLFCSPLCIMQMIGKNLK